MDVTTSDADDQDQDDDYNYNPIEIWLTIISSGLVLAHCCTSW